MDKFAEIKTLLKEEEVIEHYLGKPEKRTYTGIWYKSPFRKEKTASFCVSEKGIHDFGSSEHYDIISFVAKYFNTDNYKALKILCNDFGLSLLEEKEDKETIRQLKEKREKERKRKLKIEIWFNDKIQNLCDEIQENKKLIKENRKLTKENKRLLKDIDLFDKLLSTLQNTVNKLISWVSSVFKVSEESLINTFEDENNTFINPMEQLLFEDNNLKEELENAYNDILYI